MEQRFRVLTDFKDERLKSVYKANMIYTVRRGNKLLKKKLAAWVQAGKVELVMTESTGTLVGRGVVK